MATGKKIGILTSGGDCAGLNAVIRAVTRCAIEIYGWEVHGICKATHGLMSRPPESMRLSIKQVDPFLTMGGTFLGTTNKGDPFAFPMGDGSLRNRSEEIIEGYHQLGLDALIGIGGDGSLAILRKLAQQGGINLVGIPKTIDNDVGLTERSIGFDTAVNIATEAIDRLHFTAASHSRVMIVEVMGRDAGWIALHTAIAGGAEICLIPEIPYHMDVIVERLQKRYNQGRGFVNLVIAEGAKPIDGEVTATQGEAGRHAVRLGGVAYTLSHQLKEAGVEVDIRETVLGHIQRGGTPIAYDRVLASIFGVQAFERVLNGDFGRMVVLKDNEFSWVPLAEAIEAYNVVNPNGTLVSAARGLGISFGDAL